MDLFDAELPQGWHWVTLRQAYRPTKRPRDLSLRADDKIVFAPMDAIPQAGNHAIRLSERRWSEVKSGVYFAAGDVLLSKITPSFENGKQGLAIDLPKSFGFASTEIIPLQPIDNRNSSWFLFYYLLHPEVRTHLTERMEGSTGRQRVPEDAVLDLPVPIPSPEVQAQIATILRTVQRARDIQQRSAELSNALKHSTMRELFTHGLRGEGQKETEIGSLPENWRVEQLGPHLKRAQYGLSVKGHPSAQHPILRMNCQIDGRVVFRDLQYVDLEPRMFEAFRVADGDLLFNRTNSYELVGRTAIFRSARDAVFASYLIRLTLDPDVFVPEFVNCFFNRESTQAELKKLASRGVSQANISASKLKEFLVPWAPLDEQHDIVKVIEAIDRKIDLHKRKRDVLDELFRSLLHKLMTGEIRVSDLSRPDIDTADQSAADHFVDVNKMV